MTIYVNKNGTWINITQPKVNANGIWTPIKAGYIRVGGVWQRFFPTKVTADILTVGGGGAGGSTGQDEGGGGGGAGGVILSPGITLDSGTTYTIIVGAGGVTYNNSAKTAFSQLGGTTSVSGPDITTITAYGGGGGGNYSGAIVVDNYGHSAVSIYYSGEDGASGGGGSGPGQYHPGGKAIYGNQGNDGDGGPHEAPGGGGGGYAGAAVGSKGGDGAVVQSNLDAQSWSVGGGGGGGASKYSGSDGGNGGSSGGGDGDGDSAHGGKTYAAQSSGGGGDSCFIGSALVTLASGKQIPIDAVKIGDFVYNYNQTQVNIVKFIEVATDSDFRSLYTPTQEYAPFATINHPLYIAGVLSTPVPDQIDNWYPWLNVTGKITPTLIESATGKQVYNLWVDGDGTYIVNQFGTTSIIGDGGVLRLCVEQGLFSSQRVSELLYKFTNAGKYVVWGAYIINAKFGKLNIKPANQFLAWVYQDDSKPQWQKFVNTLFKITGFFACKIKGK